MTILRIITGDEVVEVAALQWILISTAALPLRADAPPVYLAAARFFESEVTNETYPDTVCKVLLDELDKPD